jgi:hypothetical protein
MSLTPEPELERPRSHREDQPLMLPGDASGPFFPGTSETSADHQRLVDAAGAPLHRPA